ncbi:hypothetical protein L2E82_19152 [Cichorium intybus]|uniref:Uncharacterized protein n=1 Tax=Cichorium intybus TaxID=13427 RepID=A0ACB9FC38_CICIN|nr:hypothetical protein L2E82_19152 [Cichorium intybus]
MNLVLIFRWFLHHSLADEYGIEFLETVSKKYTNMNVDEVFFSIGSDIKQRLAETDTNAEPHTIKINQQGQIAGSSERAQKSGFCGS